MDRETSCHFEWKFRLVRGGVTSESIKEEEQTTAVKKELSRLVAILWLLSYGCVVTLAIRWCDVVCMCLVLQMFSQ